MFKTWMQEHDIAQYPLSERLFPAADDRQFWEAVIPASCVESAAAYRGFEWPLIRATQYMAFYTSNDRLAQETPHFARRRALMALFLGELAEDKGQFLPDITDGLFAICEETSWGLSAHRANSRMGEALPPAHEPYVDLYASETAELVSVIYHVLYDRLKAFCPPIVERVEYELDRRIVQPYLHNTTDWWWMGYGGGDVNNWLPWILQNVLTVAVTAPIDEVTRVQILRKSFLEIQRYYDSIPDDGGCDEGSTYWTKAGAKLFLYGDVLYRTSGGAIDLFGDDKLRRIGRYIAHAHIGGCRFVNFADGAGWIRAESDVYPIYGYGLRTGEQSFCSLAATVKRAQAGQGTIRGYAAKAVLFSLIHADEIDAQPDYQPPAFAVLPDLQNAFLRCGDWYVAAKGGHNAESHNHNDVGSFIVFINGEPLLVDPGVGVYTRLTFSKQRYEIPTMQSAYHNLPLLNGVMQQNGAQFRATAFSADEHTVEIAFGDAYPTQAGVRSAVRTIAVNEDGISVADRFAFEGDNRVCEQFMTPLPVQVNGDTAILGGQYRLCAEGAVCQMDTLDFEGDANLTKAWGVDHLNRIRFTVQADAVHITLERMNAL